MPFAIIAFVMWRRWKNIGTPVALRTGRMWIMPAIMSVLIGAMLYALPPAPLGWGVFAMGLVIGLAVGWQRARLMHFHLDEQTGAVMMRQSPLAFLFIVALFLARRLLIPSRSAQASGQVAAHGLPLITDALLGFALGMIVGMRLEMWRRAKALRAA
ncbi:cytochrome c biogenesis protein CcdC [Novosphingobium sp. MW5]|nr:cytochrome c biogenesis protein CcdC [Novosphingobium sp. MW5]